MHELPRGGNAEEVRRAAATPGRRTSDVGRDLRADREDLHGRPPGHPGPGRGPLPHRRPAGTRS
ncbi:hypothetical protein G5V59_18525 [Nocardioides sp. W3-2-3]|nr:hypothetical protein [Nocardioides convexus]